MAAQDLTGHTFGSWIVIGASEKSGYVKCRCECGTVKDVYIQSLKTEKVQAVRLVQIAAWQDSAVRNF